MKCFLMILADYEGINIAEEMNVNHQRKHTVVYIYLFIIDSERIEKSSRNLL